ARPARLLRGPEVQSRMADGKSGRPDPAQPRLRIKGRLRSADLERRIGAIRYAIRPLRGNPTMSVSARLLFLGVLFSCGFVVAQEKGDKTGNGDITVGPDYALDPDLKDNGNPKGQGFDFLMPLAESKIFKGDDATLDPKK